MVFSQGGFLEKVSLCAFFLNAAVYELIGNQDLPNKAEYSLCEKKKKSCEGFIVIITS